MKNAIRLAEDGELLLKGGRFLGAINSLRLASEELGKVQLCVQAILIRKTDATGWKRFWSAFVSHQKKIELLESALTISTGSTSYNPREAAQMLRQMREDCVYVDFDQSLSRFQMPEDQCQKYGGAETTARAELKSIQHELSVLLPVGMPTPDLMVDAFRGMRDGLKFEDS